MTADATRTAADAGPLVDRLRAARPDPAFTLSMRVAWDGLAGDADEQRRELAAMAEAGFQHLLATPLQSNLDDWLRSVEALWKRFSEL